MDAVLQNFLIGQVDQARLGPLHYVATASDWRRLTIERFSAQLDGFRGIALLSETDVENWSRRMKRAVDL